MNVQLKITKKCGRCGKVEEFSGTLADAQRLEQQAQARAATAAHLDELVQSLSSVNEPPQVIVMMLNDETKQYDYKVLYDLCDKKAEKEGQRRGCKARVVDLIADVFNIQLGEPKVRKPRTKKEPAAPEAPPVIGETEEDI